MDKVLFKVNARSLPEDMLAWKWEQVPYHPWNMLPESPCVFVITKIEYGTTIPLQVSFTGNLKRFINSGQNVGVPAHNRVDNTSVIHYVVEKNESTRRLMRDRLKSFLGLDMAY